ncbi:hypothetical protein Pelo_5564 [Pelomyxa schiedti]|nr:hypothetical protein Pelo_5564 [Pelomyxa schiedti]
MTSRRNYTIQVGSLFAVSMKGVNTLQRRRKKEQKFPEPSTHYPCFEYINSVRNKRFLWNTPQLLIQPLFCVYREIGLKQRGGSNHNSKQARARNQTTAMMKQQQKPSVCFQQ